MHPNVKHVLQNQQHLIVRQGEIMSRVPGNLESMGHEVQRLRRDGAENLDQAMLYLDAKFDYGISYAKDYALRIESTLDYLISRIGPHGSWLPCVPPYYGYSPFSAPPPAFQYEESRSSAGPSDAPRGLAPVSSITTSAPRWTPVAHQQPLLQGATQPSLTVTTTATTTTTTATTATTTTSLVVGNLKVNYRLQDVADICAEVQKYDQEIQKAGKKKVPTLERKHQKQVSNKRHVLKQVEHLAAKLREEDVSLGEEDAFHKAISRLNMMKQTSAWSVNQLIDYCRVEKATRDKAQVANNET
ncbi:hypothetical protein KVV02_004385 [Mortierella alpina]|uniref:Uncharacterized protein n=1 Tax=Mortierella alpina TaxID=64518 RepID=A0A9P7ZW64_MORAP|nr:hypothetical protein KVV02_004385 [Mortierella alpina]